MTKEETAYAETLNLLGSDLPAPTRDAPLIRTLGDLRFEALASAMPPGPKVRCHYCPEPFPYDGPAGGEHFADLWEHLITRHRVDPRAAEGPAQYAWGRPYFVGMMAA